MSRDGTLPPGVEHWNIEDAQDEEWLEQRAFIELLNQIREGRSRAAWSERYELDGNGEVAILVSENAMGVSLIEFEKDGIVVSRVKCRGVAR